MEALETVWIEWTLRAVIQATVGIKTFTFHPKWKGAY